MGIPQPQNGGRFTYADYLTWPEGERWELIEGVPYDMTPTPSPRHQDIGGGISSQFRAFLRGKPCRAFPAPFDVRLPEGAQSEDQILTVVQPDLSVICDPGKLDRRGCLGAPDLVLEVLSPSTAARDQIQKTALYEKHGVREYWILHPVDRILTVYTRADGRFAAPRIVEAAGRIPVGILPELEVDFDSVFESAADLE